MFLDLITANLDLMAFLILAICISLTIISGRIAKKNINKAPLNSKLDSDVQKYKQLFNETAKMKEIQFQNSKLIRKAYRKDWADNVIDSGQLHEVTEQSRNLIMTNTAVLSAVLISFGLLISGFTVLEQNSIGSSFDLKIISMTSFLIYALFMLISESRILNYAPILAWVDAEVINKVQGEDKATYIAKLMDDAFDRFSAGLKCIFYAIACVFWFFSTPIFIIATIVLTVVIIQSDHNKSTSISIF